MISRKEFGFAYKDKTIFEQLLFTNTVRGVDSTGIFGINKYGNLIAHKTANAAPTALKTATFADFFSKIFNDYRIVIGHNRASTRGATTDENAHPFIEGDICLVHNGTLHSHKHLADKEVDSHAICHSLAEKGYKETFENINGAFALIWYDAATKKLHMARNKERPLYMAVTPETFYFASEVKMLQWILQRNDVKDVKCFYLEVNKTYTWDLDDRKEFAVEDTPKKPTPPVSYTKPSCLEAQSYHYPTKKKKHRRAYGKDLYKNSSANDEDEGIQYVIGSVIEFYNKGASESKRKNLNLIGYTVDGAETPVICQIPSRLAAQALEELLDCEYIQATVSMIYNNRGKESLCVRDPVIMDKTVVSLNDTFVTRELLEEHGGHCRTCHKKLTFDDVKEIEDAHITTLGGKIDTITCDDCLSDYKRWDILDYGEMYA
jgi:hypothetical protein